MSEYPTPSGAVVEALRGGQVIPAHPLALTDARKLDERRQRALTRYYHAAGAGGIAVAVHTTQMAVHRPAVGLYRPVLALAAETIAACDADTGRQTIRIAGICGQTGQALAEAMSARDLGYHVGLLSLADLAGASDDLLIAHCRAVGQVVPLMGFYLQPAAGGRLLSLDFWRRFAEIPNVVAIKVAPFNRYQTLDVVRAVAESKRAGEIALYTGNDDNILADLLTEYAVRVNGSAVEVSMVGGLLGHWACWTKRAVEQLAQCKQARRGGSIPAALLMLAARVTEANAAVFDAANGFAGCIPGVHEVLRRQGLLANNYCLNPAEVLSAGQAAEIDRIQRCYPELFDDAFVRENLHRWLA